MAMLVWGALIPLLVGGSTALPMAASGLVFLSSAVILISSGALAELVYKLGDMRDQRFSRLTARIWN
jgi:hypothetical protein